MVQGGIPAEKEGILKVSRSNLIVWIIPDNPPWFDHYSQKHETYRQTDQT